jgi:hypothetical protein
MTQPTETFTELDLKLVQLPGGIVRLIVIENKAVTDIMETDDGSEKSVRRIMNEILRLVHVKGFTPEKLAVRLKG